MSEEIVGRMVRITTKKRNSTGLVGKIVSRNEYGFYSIDNPLSGVNLYSRDEFELVDEAQPPADTPPTLEDVLCDQPQPFIVSSLMLKFLSSGEFIYLVREIVREGYSIPEAQTIARHLNAQADKEWLVTRNTQPADTPPAAPSETTQEKAGRVFNHLTTKVTAAQAAIDAGKEYIAELEAERDELRRLLVDLTRASVAFRNVIWNTEGTWKVTAEHFGADLLMVEDLRKFAEAQEAARLWILANGGVEATKGASDE